VLQHHVPPALLEPHLLKAQTSAYHACQDPIAKRARLHALYVRLAPSTLYKERQGAKVAAHRNFKMRPDKVSLACVTNGTRRLTVDALQSSVAAVLKPLLAAILHTLPAMVLPVLILMSVKILAHAVPTQGVRICVLDSIVPVELGLKMAEAVAAKTLMSALPALVMLTQHVPILSGPTDVSVKTTLLAMVFLTVPP
jgi:hypothetical protein